MDIENTRNRDPLLNFGSLFGGNPGYIRAQERAGQEQFVHSDRMPTDSPTADLEVLGFTFGDPDPHDPMFRPATLPGGWKREGSDHDMWSYIVDDKGRKRVSVFYKAAFYDRSAHASIVSPTAHISDLIYADSDPTTVTLDELCTADLSRLHLREALRNAKEMLSLVPADSADRYRDRIARINLIIGLVDAAEQA